MERKDFIRQAFSALGIIAIVPLADLACSKSGVPSSTGNDSTTTGSGSATSVTADTDCKVTPTETEGPFPTKTPYPSNYVRSDIRKGDDIGITLTSTITVVDVSNGCTPLSNVYVDIWHCDVDGDYSEYGGTQMQSDDYTSYTWLRGRQLTDSNGQVKFISIFPGWYQSRATHIHTHVFDTSGNTLLISQIAFDDALCIKINSGSYKAEGYTKGTSGYTYNNADNVFSDGYTQEISTVTAVDSSDYTKGFTLAMTLRVS